MAFNYSVTAFIKSPWTQFDFTHFLKEALSSMFVSQPKGLQAQKQTKLLQVVQGNNSVWFYKEISPNRGLEATLMMKNVER